MSHAILDRDLLHVGRTSDQWYFRHGGDSFGPYDTHSLRDVIVAAGIRAGLELRHGTQREWKNVPAVGKMLERIDEGLPPIADQSKPAIEPRVDRSAASCQSTVRRQVSAAPNSAHRATFALSPRTSFVRSFARKELTVLAVMLLVWLAVNAVVVGSYAGSHSTERGYSREIQLIWDEFQETRRRSASDEGWNTLQCRAEERLKPIIGELTKTADTRNPIRQHLLWAARDYLPKMLRDARQEPSDAEQLFEKHMEETRRLLAAPR